MQRNDGARGEPPSCYLDRGEKFQISLSAGVVVIRFGTASGAGLEGKVLTIVPIGESGEIAKPGDPVFKWICGARYSVPATTVPDRLLPYDCREQLTIPAKEAQAKAG